MSLQDLESESGTRLIGLDIGEKRTGVALSDESRMLSTPWKTLEHQGKKDWIRQVLALLSEKAVAGIVVGVPLDQWGEDGASAVRIQTFIDLLRKRTKVPVIEWDERFTTVQAERRLIEADVRRRDRRDLVDKVAAAIILQAYLDSQAHSTSLESDQEHGQQGVGGEVEGDGHWVLSARPE